MNGADLAEINRQLLATAMLIAPTGEVQQGFAALARSTPSDAVPTALLGAMLDGLRYGNWPDPKLI